MTEIVIDKYADDEEIYAEVQNQLEFLLLPTDKLISSLSNFTSLLKQAFQKISWIGFYIAENQKLFLGPFHGNTACTEIKIGEGVCGTVALKQKTIIVDDVNNFQGHIACDSKSKSEIVVPILVNSKLWGVLDLDSYNTSSFSKLDKIYLEKFCNLLVNKLELEKFVLT